MFASAVINEAYLKTIMSLGIEILSKIDTSKTRKEISDHYVNMFKDNLQIPLQIKQLRKISQYGMVV
jgi:hypothetical protein